jgi:hypothetical protein
MLKSSRTWPSILTMAVVQLKFDQKGKYSYSAIANIDQSHKQQLIESTVTTTNGNLVYGDGRRDIQCPHNSTHKKDLISRKNVKSRSLTTNQVNVNGRQQNGGSHSHNGNPSNCTAPGGKNGKVCLCELEFRDNRKRSESIKVDNWDYIYKEKAFAAKQDVPEEQKNSIPK